MLDELLAESGWRHPSDLIESDVLEVYYPRLICLASLRAERAEDPAPLLELRDRLAEAHAEVEDGQKLLETVLQRVDSFSPDVAERVLACLASHYRLRCEQQGSGTV